MKLKKLILIFFMSTAAWAAKDDAQTPKTQVGGNFDLNYLHNGNGPARASGGQNAFRVFDRFHNQFTLNMAELTLSRTLGEVAIKADLTFGEMVDFIATDNSRFVGQALLTYSPESIPGLSFTLGKGYTHVGLELTKAKDNWQYSRSFIYRALPIWHVGVNASYAIIPDRMTGGLYIYNDTNSLRDDNNDKQIGGQLGFIPLQGLTVYYNLLTGAENANDDRTRRTAHNFNAVWGVVENHSVALDTLFLGQTGSTGSTGIAFSTKHQLGASTYFSPRIEHFSDKGGIVHGVSDRRLIGLTLTLSHMLARGLDTRLEFRNDSSNLSDFQKGDGTTSRSQLTGAVALLYSF